jgi:hypothetical protein
MFSGLSGNEQEILYAVFLHHKSSEPMGSLCELIGWEVDLVLIGETFAKNDPFQEGTGAVREQEEVVMSKG